MWVESFPLFITLSIGSAIAAIALGVVTSTKKAVNQAIAFGGYTLLCVALTIFFFLLASVASIQAMTDEGKPQIPDRPFFTVGKSSFVVTIVAIVMLGAGAYLVTRFPRGDLVKITRSFAILIVFGSGIISLCTIPLVLDTKTMLRAQNDYILKKKHEAKELERLETEQKKADEEKYGIFDQI